MKAVDTIVPQVLGWLEVTLDDTEIQFLWDCIREGEKVRDNYKKRLAGAITESWILTDKDDWFWKNVLLKLCGRYAGEFENIANQAPVNNRHPLCLDQMWMNRQRQTEFNPIHFHSGVYSFVIWMQIPTHYKEQSRIPIAYKTNSNSISNFAFEFLDIRGEIRSFTYLMEPDMAGKLLFFPANLRHQVYPFYNCGDDRISISGNITLDTSRISPKKSTDTVSKQNHGLS